MRLQNDYLAGDIIFADCSETSFRDCLKVTPVFLINMLKIYQVKHLFDSFGFLNILFLEYFFRAVETSSFVEYTTLNFYGFKLTENCYETQTLPKSMKL